MARKLRIRNNKMPAPLVGAALRLAAAATAKKAATRAATAAARKVGKATPAQKAKLQKASASSAKTKAAVEKRAMKNIGKPVPLSNKPLTKITGVKPGSGFKNPKPATNKWSDGGNAKLNAATKARTMDTMRPLTSLEKSFGTGRNIGGVKVVKASPDTATKMNAARTLAGKERQAAALKKAEEIRKAKAVQRLLEIKSSTKFK
jgi:hypothetical protein